MRIVGGSARGRRLKSPRGQVRPTSDRVREALFSIIQASVPGAGFLDLFAGSGAVGLEALSRGARHVDFVEEHQGRAEDIRALLEELGWKGKGRVWRTKALKFLEKTVEKYDLVFVDPPYGSPDLVAALTKLVEVKGIRPGGMAILEHPTKSAPPERADELLLQKRYRYGDTTLSVYRLDQESVR